MADYPSMVLLLAAAFFVVRSLSATRWTDAALAGVLLGAAVGLKPPNGLMGFGAVFAYLVARRWRDLLVFGAAIVPSLLVLAFWKERGLGAIPALAAEQVRLAAGYGVVAVDVSVHRYLPFDVNHWKEQMDSLREFFWSARLVQWAPFAGFLAVLRVRRGAIAALLGGWLGAFVLVKGFSTRASIEDGSFWRLLMPAWPAYLLLFASVPLLIPTLARRLGDRLRVPSAPPVRVRWVVVALLLAVGVPAVATAASSRVQPPTPTVIQEQPDGTTIMTPVDTDIHVKTQRVGNAERITWSGDGPWGADVFYRVFRTDHAGSDTLCVTSNSVSWYCYLKSTTLETTRARSYLDRSPVRAATYRIGVGTNWANDPSQGDIFDFSPPVRAAPGSG
jgi:hypothetical protein